MLVEGIDNVDLAVIMFALIGVVFVMAVLFNTLLNAYFALAEIAARRKARLHKEKLAALLEAELAKPAPKKRARSKK